LGLKELTQPPVVLGASPQPLSEAEGTGR